MKPSQPIIIDGKTYDLYTLNLAVPPSFQTLLVADPLVTVAILGDVSTVIVNVFAYTLSPAAGAKIAVPFHQGEVAVVSLQLPLRNARTSAIA